MSHERGIDDGSIDRSEEEAQLRANISRLKKLCDSTKPEERQERDTLLIYLRKKGYTRSEIRDIIGRRLKEDTIRKIISGVEPEESAIRERIAQLIVDMIKADLGFDDIRAALKIRNELPDGVIVKELASLLADVQQSPDAVGGVKGVVSMYSEMKAQQGLTFAQVKEFLVYQREISLAGIQTMHLQKISEVAKKYRKGDINQLMDALSSFDSLESINGKIKKEQVLLEEATKKRETAEKDSKIAMAEHAHLREAITVCKDMIMKFGFTTAAFNDVYELAKKCGTPTEVLNALAEYKDMKELSAAKTRLSSEVKALQEDVSELKGQRETIKNSVTGLLTPVSNEITKAFSEGAKRIGDEYDKQIKRMMDVSVEYGRRQEAAAYYAEDLKRVKIIRTITTYPEEARKIPTGFAVTLLTAAKNILIAKGNHSKIKKVRAMVVPHHDYRADEEIEALVLVNGAIMALESAAAAAGGATTVDT